MWPQHIHLLSTCQGLLKSETVDNLEKYITKEVCVCPKVCLHAPLTAVPPCSPNYR